MTGEVFWRDGGHRELLTEVGELVDLPFDFEDIDVDGVPLPDEEGELFSASVDELLELVSILERRLEGNDLDPDGRAKVIELLAFFQARLLCAELELMTATPAARLLHFNPTEEDK